jgi:hypothetical protein
VGFNIAKHFVDRRPERELFHRMLTGEIEERVLLVFDRAEQGKSCFLLRLEYECLQKDPVVPVILLDFDQARSGLTDYLSVAREVRGTLGDALTPEICGCERNILRPGPFVAIRTGDGDAGIDHGQRNRYNDAEFNRNAGRDAINVGDVNVQPTLEQRIQQKVEMGRALCNDLAILGEEHNRIVVLIDTFEQTTEDTRTWLERWLFNRLTRELTHVVVVMTGRPTCRDFFTPIRRWSHLTRRLDNFTPLSDEDILTHMQNRGIPIGEEESALLLDLVRGRSPARMAQFGDKLRQERGGQE